ncbi:MAG: hypothetical protein QNJ63_28920 [Calothrix sp. MO_192.B10]|nr:hypothetical protein [Calothrix sp. MO_192.B10]
MTSNQHPDRFLSVLSLNLPGIIYQEILHVIYLQEYFLLFYLVLFPIRDINPIWFTNFKMPVLNYAVIQLTK